MEGTKLLPGELQQLGFAGVAPSVFISVGVFFQPARLILVQNLTDQLLEFSMDGLNSHFVLPACSSVTFDAGTNKGTPNTAAFPQGYGVFVTAPGTLPTTGSIYLTYFYAA